MPDPALPSAAQSGDPGGSLGRTPSPEQGPQALAPGSCGLDDRASCAPWGPSGIPGLYPRTPGTPASTDNHKSPEITQSPPGDRAPHSPALLRNSSLEKDPRESKANRSGGACSVSPTLSPRTHLCGTPPPSHNSTRKTHTSQEHTTKQMANQPVEMFNFSHNYRNAIGHNEWF